MITETQANEWEALGRREGLSGLRAVLPDTSLKALAYLRGYYTGQAERRALLGGFDKAQGQVA